MEKLGEEFPTKLRYFIYTHRDNLPILFGIFVTLVSADWFSNALSQSVVFFCAQNCLHYQINKHEMQG